MTSGVYYCENNKSDCELSSCASEASKLYAVSWDTKTVACDIGERCGDLASIALWDKDKMITTITSYPPRHQTEEQEPEIFRARKTFRKISIK